MRIGRCKCGHSKLSHWDKSCDECNCPAFEGRSVEQEVIDALFDQIYQQEREITAYQIAKDNALWQDMTQFFSHRNDAEDRAIMWLTQNVPSWQVY